MWHTIWQVITQLVEYWRIIGFSVFTLITGWVILPPIGVWPLTVMTGLQRILLFLLIVCSALLLWLIPPWQAARPGLEPMERFTAENEARKTLAQILGGAAVLASLLVAWGTLEVNREGQITDRFTKAIAQLGDQEKTDLTVRLGGIYALERIARDSERDHWPVMEVLTTYVREPPSWRPKDEKPLKDGPACMEALPSPTEFRLATDIQAMLTVIGRRTRTYQKGEKHCLNLANADLRTADLRDAKLQSAILYKAHLEGAYLQDINLEDAYLRGADLRRACLHRAKLQGAHLRDAQLQDADLLDAQLQGAGLQDAKLQGANLKGASLQGACLAKATLPGKEGVTVEQLLTAKTLYGATGAIFDDPSVLQQIDLRRPSLWDEPPRHNPNDPDDLCAESSQP